MIISVFSTIYQDALLEKYNTTEIFSELELHETRRPKRSIFVSFGVKLTTHFTP